jgi:hypothetical protein
LSKQCFVLTLKKDSLFYRPLLTQFEPVTEAT